MCNRKECGNPNDTGDWCGACHMHYSTWNNHIQLYRHNHRTDTTAEGLPDYPPKDD